MLIILPSYLLMHCTSTALSPVVWMSALSNSQAIGSCFSEQQTTYLFT